MVPSIALKRWNCPRNLYFKGKIVAKFLLRTHFLSKYDNKATNQRWGHSKSWIHFSFLSVPPVSHFVSFTLSSPLCYSLKMKETMEWEKKRCFVYVAAPAYYLISKKQNNVSLDIIVYLDTHVCINNPHWQINEIITLLCKYCIVISDTLIGSWICFSFCSL